MGECLVPWCTETVTIDPSGPGEVHHIIERELWPDGGYIPENGASVCNVHHQLAERDIIPPQAFWRWAGIEEIIVPEIAYGQDSTGHWVGSVETANEKMAINKWGESFEVPPHADLRQYPKYPSTRHLLPAYWHSPHGSADDRTGRDDTGYHTLSQMLDIPLVITHKLDGSNAMLVADTDAPVRARNGRDADHVSFDHLKSEYWERNVYETLCELGDGLQVFGENVYAKHSIHYGCPTDCCGGCDERNRGPALEDVFYVFGVYDTHYQVWLSWRETQAVAEEIGFPAVPAVGTITHDRGHGLERELSRLGDNTIEDGHEGIIVRSQYPFHWGQFETFVGKYVRPNHVQTDEHWSHQQVVRNGVSG